MTGLRINLTYDPSEKGPCAECDRARFCAYAKTACDDFRYFVYTGVTYDRNRLVTHEMYRRIFRGEFEQVEVIDMPLLAKVVGI